MAKPPAGVDDVFAATMVLLAGVSPSVVTTKAGKVKDRSWDAAKKQLLGKFGLFAIFHSLPHPILLMKRQSKDKNK